MYNAVTAIYYLFTWGFDSNFANYGFNKTFEFQKCPCNTIVLYYSMDLVWACIRLCVMIARYAQLMRCMHACMHVRLRRCRARYDMVCVRMLSLYEVLYDSGLYIYIYIYICIHTHTYYVCMYTHIHTYIYIYIERERCMCMCIYIYVYYTQRLDI